MNDLVQVEGYWEDEPSHVFTVLVSRGSWNGEEDDADSRVFYYMDGQPLTEGAVIAEDFVVEKVLD